MATNTAMNVGIRRNTPFGMRNFEDDGTTQYASNHDGLDYLGTLFDAGDTITFDVGGTSYSADGVELLRRYWNQNWIEPLS